MIDTKEMNPETEILDDFGHDWAWAYAIFRPLAWLPKYWIGSNGSVWYSRGYRSCPRLWLRAGRTKNQHGHVKVRFTLDKRPVFRYVHRLVLETFIGMAPLADLAVAPNAICARARHSRTGGPLPRAGRKAAHSSRGRAEDKGRDGPSQSGPGAPPAATK